MKIAYRTWKHILDTEERTLSREYTNIFYKEFKKTNSYCPLVFKSKYFQTSRSRPETPYLTVNAKCKFDQCCTYVFRINKTPVKRKRILVKVHRFGDFNHSTKKTQKRHVKGASRKCIAESLKTTTTLDYQAYKYATMKGDEIAGGNITDPQTRDVLRKIKSEQLQGNLCTDVFQEVKILMETYRGIVDGGFIQTFSFLPFKVSTLFHWRETYLHVTTVQVNLYLMKFPFLEH